MDKNAIKKYAIWARNELIARIAQKATKYGVLEKNSVPKEADSINGRLLSAVEKKQRQALLAKVEENGYENTIEEVAYTWFNRFIALRFMEVNGYLPTHIRVFTNADNAFSPEIMDEAANLEFEGLNIEKVYNYKENNEDEDLFRYLLILQCNALNKILPIMFQKLEDYTELLLPDNLLREGSVIYNLIDWIPEEDWQDQVQIIGWLYQYYNTEPKDKVFANLKKNIKISKENIPAATQLFTPDWIVRYMVENSLGRLWVEGHPNDELKANWKYYLEEAEQEPEVQAQLAEIRKEYAQLQPEDLLCIDPAQGSGHILCYMFDVLMQIYEAYGYTSKEAVKNIVEKNIWGLDIDERASQLAYFSVMMKARQYDRRFFSHIVQPNVFAIEESNGIDKGLLQYFGYGMEEPDKNIVKTQLEDLLKQMYDAKEYGSIINVDACEWNLLKEFVSEYDAGEAGLFETANLYEVQEKLEKLVSIAQALGQKYHAVVTNPPYMGNGGMSNKLCEFAKKYYFEEKMDLFACFIHKGNEMVVSNGFNCMVTMQSWMFLSSFEKMRHQILSSKCICALMHMENMVMGIAFGTAVSCIRNSIIAKYRATYNYVKQKNICNDIPFEFPIKENRFFQVDCNRYKQIPGEPVAYWVSNRLVNAYSNSKISDISISDGQTKTGNNDKYLRNLWEIDSNKINQSQWALHAKGGSFRRWYGNLDTVIDWTPLARKHYKEDHVARIAPEYIWFRKGISWTLISSSSKTGFRLLTDNATFNLAAPSVFFSNDNELYYILGYLNTKISEFIIRMCNPTLNTNISDITNQPYINNEEFKTKIIDYVKENIGISKTDWDSFETSWDFKRHPLISDWRTMEVSFAEYLTDCNEKFTQLKTNEEELNRIFIDIYGLQDELTPEIEEKDITIHKVFDSKEDVPESMKNSNYVLTKQDVVKSFISYAVGCMFGRYSLDVEGLAYAGGDWNEACGIQEGDKKVAAHDWQYGGKYKTFAVDPDNIIPICDDEYFDDDIAGRFIDFVKTVFGAETLEENLKFIADALGGKGSPREIIRSYFLNSFYADHCKTYQKRPIYWLFDSGKKNGFKCLIYMHRYQPDTIARIRTDYVHEQQARYNTAMEDLLKRIDGASASERAKLGKQLSSFQAKDAELREYEEKIHYLADRMIKIDLDDGVKHNYELFKDVLAKIK